MTGSLQRRRAVHDIVVEILKSAIDGDSKTHLMYRVGLNHSQVDKYLEALNDSGFIKQHTGIWKTTEKGHHLIDACEMCLRLSKEIYRSP